jgi:antibiotic biosynthesis monooxygenase (ABM) superfamily enzyme
MGKSRKKSQPTRKSPPNRRTKSPFNRQAIGRRLLIIFLLSFFISTALIIYVFGMTADFFPRMFWCLLVIFFLISLTALGIIPLVNRLLSKWPK